MSDVSPTFQVTFRNNVELLLGQNRSLLRDAIVEQDAAGAEKLKVLDTVSAKKPLKALDRHGDTVINRRDWDGVWLPKPPKIYDDDLVDREDQLATRIDLSSNTMKSIVATIELGWDDADLAGIYGSIISGKDGTTTTPFPNGMIVPVTTGAASGNARMNVAKLRAANKLLAQKYNNPRAKKWMILTAEQNDDLLSEVPATSSDFKASFGGEVDENGNVTRLLGWNFIHMELGNPLLDSAALSLDGSGFRKTPFWVEGGLVRGVWERLFTSIDPVPMKRHSKLIYAESIVATTRTQPGMVGLILNSEAA